VASCRGQAKIDGRVMRYEETLVVIRSLNQNGEATQYDFYLSNAPRQTPEKEFARVALAAHRIEEAIKRGKSEAGLSHYEVRNWRGWHHHQILSLMATWFLVLETHRGKKMDAGDYPAAGQGGHRDVAESGVSMRHVNSNCPEQNSPPEAKRTSPSLSLQIT